MAAVKQSDRSFGLMLATVLGLVAAVGYGVFGVLMPRVAAVGLAFAAVALLVPQLLLPLNRLWARLAGVLSVVSNHVLLGIFFFALLLPMGAVMRLLGRDPAHRKLEGDAESYWTPVGRQSDPDTFPDMF